MMMLFVRASKRLAFPQKFRAGVIGLCLYDLISPFTVDSAMKTKIVIFVVGSIFVILMLTSFYMYFMIIFTNFDSKEYENRSMNTYQVSNFDTLLNTSSIGFVRLSRSLSIDEFISYRSKDNLIFSTISKLSDFQYYCFGTCSCKNEESRFSVRRNMNIISKSVYFIISAISLSLAIQISSKFFHEQCVLSLSSSECSEENIESEVEKCEEKIEEKNELEKEYLCTGYCIPNKRIKLEESRAIVQKEEYRCEDNIAEGTVKILMPETFDDQLMLLWKRLANTYNNRAKKTFVEEQLQPFCEEMSGYIVTEFIINWETEFDQEYENKFHLASTNLCSGRGGIPVFYNIHCQLVV